MTISADRGIIFTLTNPDPFLENIKYTLTVNNVAQLSNIITQLDENNSLTIDGYNGTPFANSDTIKLTVEQGLSYLIGASSDEITYSDPADFTYVMNIDLPVQPATPTGVLTSTTILNQIIYMLNAKFTFSGMDSDVVRIYYEFDYTPMYNIYDNGYDPNYIAKIKGAQLTPTNEASIQLYKAGKLYTITPIGPDGIVFEASNFNPASGQDTINLSGPATIALPNSSGNFFAEGDIVTIRFKYAAFASDMMTLIWSNVCTVGPTTLKLPPIPKMAVPQGNLNPLVIPK